jgi:RHS repeat-associated protein
MNSTYFDLQLRYNKPTRGGQYNWNGNIAEQEYSAPAMGLRWTTYQYDELNRLADGNSPNGPSETGIQYDDLGNILQLTRGSNAAYNYSYNGSQLLSVSGLTSGNYQYDQNGNMTYDARNGTPVDYNILNLPRNISGKNLSYVYDATGRKLSMTLNGTTRYYDDGIEYTSSTNNIDFIHTEEGRAINSGGNYNYEYTLSDHLGNNRVTFDVTHGKVGEQDYYPFGMSAPVQPTDNHYLYNKKELQDATGDYDYGARFYDPVIARWTAIDPLAEVSRRFSPYNYGEDNSIKNIDP